MVSQVGDPPNVNDNDPDLLGDNLPEEEKQYIDEVREKQRQFSLYLTRNGRLSADEQRALKCLTFDEFAEFWGGFCDRGRLKLQERRLGRWRGYAKKYQDFSQHAVVFMDNVKPILDVAKDAAKPWSGLAIGILTYLFVVGSNKHRIEEEIHKALCGVQDRLPDFEIMRQSYHTNSKYERDLRRQMLLAYVAFTELAIDIAQYYIQHGYRRWITAAFHSKKFKEVVDRANDRVVAVRSRCEALMNLNVSQIKQELIQVKEHNRDLQETLDRYMRGRDYEFISQLQEFLGIPSWSLSRFEREEIQPYRHRLLDEAYYEENYEQVAYRSVKSSRLEKVFSQWETSEHSSVLILTGKSNNNIRSLKRNCWLSQLAVDVADQERALNKPCGFFLFQRGIQESISEAIPVIISQLLIRRGDKALSPHKQALMSNARAFSQYKSMDYDEGLGNDGGYGKRIDALSRLLYDTIKTFGSEEAVLLVVDRIDACDEAERDEFLRNMVTLINEAYCTVKLLVVSQWVSDWKPNGSELKALLGGNTQLWIEVKEQGFKN
ncbi:hypothetical protein O1611_g1039 [Lasiodiplodia mahajangana]|uniref:Uncharacterized protein n=1 Tax=Lasiodiplodia mahajangana TaxID=1108764 RepID=A0ACC2JYT7_9PEZI|nr:hypothetical protein O1611_g1039 [Lasiodiplodia mahajangana]